jgi:hypothetical protein
MKKIFSLLFLLLLFAAPLCGQTTVVTGTVTDRNGIPYAGAQFRAGLVNANGVTLTSPVTITQASNAICQAAGRGPAPCQMPFPTNLGPFTLDANGNIPGSGITFEDNSLVSPAGTLWVITASTLGTPLPVGTGPQTCSATVTIQGAAQVITSSFSACPALTSGPGFSSTGTFGAATIFVNSSPYNAVGDRKFILDATWNSGSSTVTCLTTNDCNFTSGDNGKSCFGTAGAFVLQMPLGTLSVVSAQTATCSLATGNTTVGRFVWGTDSTAAIKNATAALYAIPTCGTLRFGSGGYLFKPGIGTAIPASCGLGISFAGENSGLKVRGEGVTSTFLTPLPTTDFSGCVSVGCFWNSTVCGTYYEDFTIDGMGQPFVAGVPTFLFSVPCSGGLKSVNLVEWMSTGSCSPHGFSLQGVGAFAYAIAVNNFGCSDIYALTSNGLLTSAFASGGLNVPGGGNNAVTDLGGIYSSAAQNSNSALNIGGTLTSYYTTAQTLGSGQAGAQVYTGGAIHLHDSIIGSGGDSSSASGLLFNGTGSIDAQNTKIFGGGTGGSLKSAAAGNGKFFDYGGNVFNQTVSPFSGGFFGSQSVTGTACALGNWALTSGWGTSSITSVTAGGDSHRCQVVITGAAGSVNPVLTWTFPTPYTVAPGSCQISFSGTLTGESTGAPTTTSVAFTFINGTPSAQTYRLDASCGP